MSPHSESVTEGLLPAPPFARRGLIVIPARLNSQRLPRKLLRADTGRPLLQYAIEAARIAVNSSPNLLAGPWVATDSRELLNVAQLSGAVALLTNPDHPDGTSRIGEVVARLPLTDLPPFILNFQADHPEIDPNLLLQLARTMHRDPHLEMATVATPFPPEELAHLHNPHVVKVEINPDSHALRFVRQVPKKSPLNSPPWYRHVGLYAYQTAFLRRLIETPPAANALAEHLEQLTPMALGARIHVAIVPSAAAGRGIDTPEDYAAFVTRQTSSLQRPAPGADL